MTGRTFTAWAMHEKCYFRQILAEIVPLEEAARIMTKRFTREVPELPQGPNTRIDPQISRFLLSDAKGYVFITMAKDNSQKTAQCAAGCQFCHWQHLFCRRYGRSWLRALGFSIQADNIRIMGMVEGGIVRARRDLMIEGGVRGGSKPALPAGRGRQDLEPLSESVEARARGNMVIEILPLQHHLRGRQHGCARPDVRHRRECIRQRLCGRAVRQPGSRAHKRSIWAMTRWQSASLKNRRDNSSFPSQTITHLKAVAGHLPPETNETTRKL